MDNYIKKPISVKAKIFEPGDEDGFETDNSKDEFNISNRQIPYISTLEGKLLYGNYGEHYIIFGNHNDKWLVRKDIFEETYEKINKPYTT
jgi:hypothetical protein